MSDLLLTLLALLGLGLAACVLVLALGVVPFVLTGDVADRSGFSALRWQTVTVAGQVAMLVLAVLVLALGWPKVLVLPALALPWLGLVVVSLLGPEERVLGGTPGAHQP